MGKQTHTTVVFFSGPIDPDGCQECGADILPGDKCEQTIMDGNRSYLCWPCARGDWEDDGPTTPSAGAAAAEPTDWRRQLNHHLREPAKAKAHAAGGH
jgi:hypothetical protein